MRGASNGNVIAEWRHGLCFDEHPELESFSEGFLNPHLLWRYRRLCQAESKTTERRFLEKFQTVGRQSTMDLTRCESFRCEGVRMLREISEVRVRALTEKEMAEWRNEDGVPTVFRHGHYWEEIRKGFFQPVHLLARVLLKDAVRPVWGCWGYRAVLHGSDEIRANGKIPAHLLTEINDYDIKTLPRMRRWNLRKCRREVLIGQLVDPSLLWDQGYHVAVSAANRTGLKPPSSEKSYREGLEKFVSDQRRIILAGVVNGRLAGYLTGHAVLRTAYMDDLFIHSDFLSTHVGTGFIYDFVQVSRNSGSFDEIFYGLHSREDTRLVNFKEGMGFPVHHLPSRVWITPPIKSYIRWRSPDKLYRLTGSD